MKATAQLQLAEVRRKGWRHWWYLSETALLAEGYPFVNIHFDEPARAVRLPYAEAAS